MRAKKTMAIAALVAAVIALSGCAKGGRELKEGMAAQLRGDWAAAEASYSASATAGNGEACRKLAELWAGPRTEELLSRELKDAAWRDAVRASMVKLANLGRQADERGVSVEGVESALARLEEAIKSSEEVERAAREAEERRIEEERRAERVRQQEERMAPLKTQRNKLNREKQRLENDLESEQSAVSRLSQELSDLKAFYTGPEWEKRQEAIVLNAVMSGEIQDRDDAYQLGMRLGEEFKAKREGIERRLHSASERRDDLQSQLEEISAELAECEEELSTLQAQLDALQNGEASRVSSTTTEVAADSVDSDEE